MIFWVLKCSVFLITLQSCLLLIQGHGKNFKDYKRKHSFKSLTDLMFCYSVLFLPTRVLSAELKTGYLLQKLQGEYERRRILISSTVLLLFGRILF